MSPITAIRLGPAWIRAHAERFPADPYPGARPIGSWRLTADGVIHRLLPQGDRWSDQVERSEVDLTDRHLVLGYGSNLNPAKLAARFAGEEIYALAADVSDWATVWCDARRGCGQGDVVSTLAPWPGLTQRHAVLAVTEEQLLAMDEWEGHPTCYRRETFTGGCVLENGHAPRVEVYVGTWEARPALRVDGSLLPVFGEDAVPYCGVDAIVPRRGW